MPPTAELAATAAIAGFGRSATYPSTSLSLRFSAPPTDSTALATSGSERSAAEVTITRDRPLASAARLRTSFSIFEDGSANAGVANTDNSSVPEISVTAAIPFIGRLLLRKRADQLGEG